MASANRLIAANAAANQISHVVDEERLTPSEPGRRDRVVDQLRANRTSPLLKGWGCVSAGLVNSLATLSVWTQHRTHPRQHVPRWRCVGRGVRGAGRGATASPGLGQHVHGWKNRRRQRPSRYRLSVAGEKTKLGNILSETRAVRSHVRTQRQKLPNQEKLNDVWRRRKWGGWGGSTDHQPSATPAAGTGCRARPPWAGSSGRSYGSRRQMYLLLVD